MRRLLLVLLLVFQPLQWGWTTAHATADTGHMVAHGHAAEVQTTLEIAPTCELSHAGDGDGDHCHDNHSHHLTVLGLGNMEAMAFNPPATAERIRTTGVCVRSPALSRIERPKWPTTPAVVSL